MQNTNLCCCQRIGNRLRQSPTTMRSRQQPKKSSVATARHKTAMIDSMLDAALKELDVVHQFDTVSNLLAQYEIVEDLSYAARRHREQQDSLIDDLNVYCLDNPGSVECRMYDL